jgi:drug/metabolite transporter (DMT)-like permease
MTWAAIILAVGAATIFGIAAVQQHRAVRTTLAARSRRLGVAQVGTLLADPGWRRGFALMVLGTGLHVAALSLAPISLTQPINVLAVPTTIIATAWLTRRRPSRSVVLGAIAVVVGVAGFVSALAGAPAGDLPTAGLLAAVGGAVVTVTLTCHLVARHLTRHPDRHHVQGRWAPLLLSVAGAVSFGVASSTFRLLALDLTHAQPLPLAVAIALVCYVPIGLTAGSWSIQQAYASGAAPTVTASSALTDPLVAITLGMAVLGETPPLGTAEILVLVAAALLAGAGVVHLARHDDSARAAGGPPPTLPTDVQHRPTSHHQTRTPDAHPARR